MARSYDVWGGAGSTTHVRGSSTSKQPSRKVAPAPMDALRVDRPAQIGKVAQGMVRLARLTIAQLRARYAERAARLPRALEAELRQDGRPGVIAMLKVIDARRRDHRREGQRLRTMLRCESKLWQAGAERVAGIDEAGMGPLAGPVAAAAVILPPGGRLPGVDDSKKLGEAERDRLAPVIRAQALAWAVAFVEPEEIDRINIYQAGLLAMRRAVEALGLQPQHLLIDGRCLPELAMPQLSLVGGDGRSLSIAAASILAKTARDERMRAYDLSYPGYGFARHKGYGTREHTLALLRLGLTPIHRRSFAPVQLAARVQASPTWAGATIARL